MTGIILLAAGESARLGEPKQLLPFENTTLLEHAIRQALKVKNSTLYVVYGEELLKLNDQLVHWCNNPNRAEGIASSIHTGVLALLENCPDCKQCIIMVCDQPFVDGNLLNNMISEAKDKELAACAYGNTIGTPALFGRKYFNDLLSLKGDEGAKRILLLHQSDVLIIPFEKGCIDIDTSDDYRKFIESLKRIRSL